MREDFGYFGDEYMLGDCMDDWALALDPELAGDDWDDLLAGGDEDEDYAPDDCPLDGDAQSALASCGWGTDEDYGLYGGDDY